MEIPLKLPLIVFDVNQTLLDLESLTPTFERIFGELSALRLWFAQLILYLEALTLAGAYVPFTDMGGASSPTPSSSWLARRRFLLGSPS